MSDLDNDTAALDIMFDNIRGILSDTCLEGETSDLLWNMVNVFQRKLDRLEKGFDKLGFEIRCSIREQDGSGVKSSTIGRTGNPRFIKLGPFQSVLIFRKRSCLQ